MVDQHLSRWHFQASKIGKIGKWYEVRLCLRLCPRLCPLLRFLAHEKYDLAFSAAWLFFFAPCMAQRERTCNIILVSAYNWIATLSSSTQYTAHTHTRRSEKGEVLSHPFPDRSASSLMRPYHFHHPHQSLSHPPNASSIHFGVSRLRGWERSNLLVGLHGQS